MKKYIIPQSRIHAVKVQRLLASSIPQLGPGNTDGNLSRDISGLDDLDNNIDQWDSNW